MKFILIIATGRSGSTTLQRIINTIPGANICGENKSAIANLLAAYESIKYSYRKMPKISGKPITGYGRVIDNGFKPCWYNCFDLDRVKLKIRELILTILDNGQGHRVLGFKEIRSDGLLSRVHLFKELFPDTRVIVNIRRDLKGQSKSSWWADNPEAYNILSDQSDQLVKYYYQHRTDTFLMTFEQLFDEKRVREMFFFLREKFDRTKYQDVLNNSLEPNK